MKTTVLIDSLTERPRQMLFVSESFQDQRILEILMRATGNGCSRATFQFQDDTESTIEFRNGRPE